MWQNSSAYFLRHLYFNITHLQSIWTANAKHYGEKYTKVFNRFSPIKSGKRSKVNENELRFLASCYMAWGNPLFAVCWQEEDLFYSSLLHKLVLPSIGTIVADFYVRTQLHGQQTAKRPIAPHSTRGTRCSR